MPLWLNSNDGKMRWGLTVGVICGSTAGVLAQTIVTGRIGFLLSWTIIQGPK